MTLQRLRNILLVLLDLQRGKDTKRVPTVAAIVSLHKGTQKEHSNSKPLAAQIPAQVVSSCAHVINCAVCATRLCVISYGF